MSAKQDAGYARTAQDLERKYKFGETFAEMLGLLNDNRDKVDSVESSLTDKITEQSTTLKRNAEEIVATAKKELTSSIEGVSDEVADIRNEVSLRLDSDAVNILIEQELSKGVDRVETSTGYTFDSDGLNISKSGEPISNELTHEGMYVKNNDGNILTADKDGVQATDLHAKTYLIVGKNDGRSRFEDYLENRTACFWIGG